MSFIQRELDRISGQLLKEDRDSAIYQQLYAVQQALSWAMEPGGFKYPYDFIMGTEANAEGYLLPLCQISSLDTRDHSVTQ